MEKGDKITELFYRISLKASFQNEIKKFRKKFEIPENGFTDEGKKKIWMDKKTCILIKYSRGENIDKKDIKFAEIGLSINNILESFEIPPFLPSAIYLFENYALTNEIDYGVTKKHPLCILDTAFMPSLKMPFIKILIYRGASQKEIVGYIQQNWETIKSILKDDGGGKPLKRIREAGNKERDKLIYELSKKSLKELNQIISDKKDYKDIAISEILLKNHDYKVSWDTVRKVMEQQRKSRI